MHDKGPPAKLEMMHESAGMELPRSPASTYETREAHVWDVAFDLGFWWLAVRHFARETARCGMSKVEDSSEDSSVTAPYSGQMRPEQAARFSTQR